MGRDLPALIAIARRHPRLPIVLDHAGMVAAAGAPKSGPSEAPSVGLDPLLLALAAEPSVLAKFTTMNLEAVRGDIPAVRALLLRFVDLFGERCIF